MIMRKIIVLAVAAIAFGFGPMVFADGRDQLRDRDRLQDRDQLHLCVTSSVPNVPVAAFSRAMTRVGR